MAESAHSIINLNTKVFNYANSLLPILQIMIDSEKSLMRYTGEMQDLVGRVHADFTIQYEPLLKYHLKPTWHCECGCNKIYEH